MDDSLSSEDFSANEEPLEVAISRLTASIAKSMSRVQQEMEISAAPVSLSSSGPATPRERRINLRLPTPTYADDYEEEEREFGEIHFCDGGHQETDSDQLCLRIERLSMLLEDLTSASLARLCAIPLTVTEPEVTALENALQRLRSENFAVISLGQVVIQAYFRAETGSAPLELDSSDESLLLEGRNRDLEPHEGEENNLQEAIRTEKILKAKCEEVRKAWKQAKRERLELQLIEKFLFEKERAIQLQTVTLSRLQRDFDAARQREEAASRERFFQAAFLKSQIETLLQDHTAAEYESKGNGALLANSDRKKKHEKELKAMRMESEALEMTDSELPSLLEAAESALLHYITTGDESRLTVKLETLKNKLLAARVQSALLRNQKKTDFINSAIEAIARRPSLLRAKNSIRNSVLQRCSTRPNSPSRVKWTLLTEESEPQSALGQLSPPETLFTTNQSSIQGDADEWVLPEKEEENKRAKVAIQSYQKRLERWESVIFDLKERLRDYKRMEKQQCESQIRVKSRERRLIAMETAVQMQRIALNSRELSIAHAEDELKSIFSQRSDISSQEIKQFLTKSAAKLTDQIQSIEKRMEEMVKLHQEVVSEQAAMVEMRREIDRKEKEVDRERRELQRERERLEVVEKGIGRVVEKMMQI